MANDPKHETAQPDPDLTRTIQDSIAGYGNSILPEINPMIMSQRELGNTYRLLADLIGRQGQMSEGNRAKQDATYRNTADAALMDQAAVLNAEGMDPDAAASLKTTLANALKRGEFQTEAGEAQEAETRKRENLGLVLDLVINPRLRNKAIQTGVMREKLYDQQRAQAASDRRFQTVASLLSSTASIYKNYKANQGKGD